jgi:hypothetical protein
VAGQVVDLLEVVEVDEEEGEGMPRSARARRRMRFSSTTRRFGRSVRGS